MNEALPHKTRIDRQFNGPNHSGNGGYVSGIVGRQIAAEGQAVTVDLKAPPPLDHDLMWSDTGDSIDLVDIDADNRVIASGRPSDIDADDPIVSPVSVDAARTARDAYEGFHDHPFPRCFTCGPDRAPGDGLQLFSGPLPDGRMACTWAPHPAFGDDVGLLAPEFTWAVLDCPGGWAAHIKEKPMVLARMTACLYRRPGIGEECIAIAALRGVERRKNHAATALYGADGTLIGRAEHIWITIDLKAFS